MFISGRKLKKTKTSYMSYYNIEVKGLNQNKTSEVDGVKQADHIILILNHSEKRKVLISGYQVHPDQLMKLLERLL